MGENGLRKIGVLEILPFGLEEMVDMNMSQSEMARFIGVRRQAINQRLMGKGRYRKRNQGRMRIYEKWQEKEQQKRVERKSLKEERGRIASFIELGAYREAKSYGELRALDYWFTRRRKVPFEKIAVLLDDYFSCKQNGQRKSYRELAKKAGMEIMTAREIIKGVGEKSLYWEVEKRKRTTPEEQVKVMGAVEWFDRLSHRDIGYLCGVSETVVKGIAREMGKKGVGFRGSYYHGLEIEGIKGRISVERVEGFYEAVDAGFSAEECLEYVSLRGKRYKPLVENRAAVEAEIRNIRSKIMNS